MPSSYPQPSHGGPPQVSQMPHEVVYDHQQPAGWHHQVKTHLHSKIALNSFTNANNFENIFRSLKKAHLSMENLLHKTLLKVQLIPAKGSTLFYILHGIYKV